MVEAGIVAGADIGVGGVPADVLADGVVAAAADAVLAAGFLVDVRAY